LILILLFFFFSVASSSIVGHVIGLGDRHIYNILIDTRTAEVVHIDLGVAFDAGMFLKVPELVPFRLTRDIVDGFGIVGVDGAFRRCCEKTLSVLRSQTFVLLSILDVFRHDPLCLW
jgi:serine-protein kinase ATM